ncbi:MAG: FadR family transcriptional regulator [Deltaproteobacteria bacterium]|nr:FadR family transcriptional regulator [Deltaproteobacteria bacterium]MBW2017415.1 FadR family transcriptional regulator [Deltaproteobacteria bacterium]MBW2130206.1 FadR family transcriptional regulator [Deltaproteobacteria bacterium]
MGSHKITPLLVPPKRERLPDTIASQLRTLIVSKKVKVGDKLPSERELAETLKVSRVVIKQALRLLEQSGFIEIKTGSRGGAFVTYNFYKPFFTAINELLQEGNLNLNHFFEARRSIEGCSVRLAVEKVQDHDIERLRELNTRVLDSLKDPSLLHSTNMAFHLAIAEITANPLIRYIIQSLLEILSVVWERYYPGATQNEDFIRAVYARHESLIEAIAERDVEECEKRIAADTEYTKNLKRG